MDFDSRIADCTDSEGQSHSQEEREFHMDIEALSLETSEAVSDGLKSCAYGVEMIEPFLQTEVAQVIGAKLVAEEAGELLVLFEEGVLPVGAEDVMAMLDLIDDGGQFPMQPFVEPHAEDLGNLVGCQPP